MVYATQAGHQAYFSKEPNDTSLFTGSLLYHSKDKASIDQPHSLFFRDVCKLTRSAASDLQPPYTQQPEPLDCVDFDIFLRQTTQQQREGNSGDGDGDGDGV
jgi:hypothetical protein